MNQEFNKETYVEIEAYITNLMSENDRQSFESRMNENEFLKKEVLLQQSLHRALNENDWDNLSSHDEEEVDNLTKKLETADIKGASKSINDVADSYFKSMAEKNVRKIRLPYYKMAIAASIILLIGFSFFFMNTNSLNSEYNNLVSWQEIPSFIEKGGDTDDNTKGEILFKAKKYNEVIDFYLSVKDLHPVSLIYLGAAYIEIDDTEKALQCFDQLIATNTIESSRGYWYKLLVYLKTDNKDKVHETLSIILQSADNYNYQKALQLSARLK